MRSTVRKNITLVRDLPQGLQVAPDLMLLTARQFVKENAELLEEVNQLRAAVNVYRELSESSGLSEEKRASSVSVRAARNKVPDSRRRSVA